MTLPCKTGGQCLAHFLQAERLADSSGLRLIFRCRYGFSKDGRLRGHIAECGGISVGPTFHSPLCKLARAIIAEDPACADLPWQLVRDGKPALKGRRLANLAALDVREDSGTYFARHKEPPTKTGHQDRRKPQFKGCLAHSDHRVRDKEEGALRAIRRSGKRTRRQTKPFLGAAPKRAGGRARPFNPKGRVDG